MVDKNAAKKLIERINKAAGKEVSFNLAEKNPTIVTDWISTGSRWLDSIICNGKVAGIPLGKVSEIAGLESCVTEDTEVEIILED
jgi:RecA/RadA recombinase